MKKSNTPRRKCLNREGRLKIALTWINEYKGKNIIKGYAKWFGIDKICAISELRSLGVFISETRENDILNANKRRIEQLRKRRETKKSFNSVNRFIESDYHFAYIADYTSGGVPFGITHEEWKEMELGNYNYFGTNSDYLNDLPGEEDFELTFEDDDLDDLRAEGITDRQANSESCYYEYIPEYTEDEIPFEHTYDELNYITPERVLYTINEEDYSGLSEDCVSGENSTELTYEEWEKIQGDCFCHLNNNYGSFNR